MGRTVLGTVDIGSEKKKGIFNAYPFFSRSSGILHSMSLLENLSIA